MLDIFLCVQVYIHSTMHGVDQQLVDKVIQVESNYKHDAIGDSGRSLGLMQVQLPTARDMGFIGSKQELLDSNNNIKYGVKYLNKLINRYNGNIKLALLAYNKGMKIADRSKGLDLSTMSYVKKVLGKSPICI